LGQPLGSVGACQYAAIAYMTSIKQKEAGS